MTPAFRGIDRFRVIAGKRLAGLCILAVAIKLLQRIASLVLLDPDRRRNVLQRKRDALGLISGSIDSEVELGNHAPIERTGQEAANAALGRAEGAEDLLVARALA